MTQTQYTPNNGMKFRHSNGKIIEFAGIGVGDYMFIPMSLSAYFCCEVA